MILVWTMIETLGNIVDAVDWLVACGVALTVACCVLLAWRAWDRRQRLDSAGWLAVSIILATSAVSDAAQIRPNTTREALLGVGAWHISMFDLAGLLTTVVVGSFLLRQTRWNRLARWFVIAAIVCGLANPLTEVIEDRLTSDPQNYAFVADDQPYRFNANSNRQLERVSTIQELSESLGAILLLAGIGLLTHKPVKPSEADTGTRSTTPSPAN
jgi:hypothetical protein